jgi:hypothetical protein
MSYLRKRYLRILIIYIFSIFLIIIDFKTVGTGYLPQVIGGGSGPLSWLEIIYSYKFILLGSFVLTVFYIYIDYWDYKRKTK